ncbi:Helicase associated domain protein [Streptomyces sp. rh34]|uniref:Helicase associated domain protein n=2 Tax=unclassified Streptomyces TaxID=2593676 RepID=UPI00211D77B8|nr:helicase associated domain-containing protein [Streptomyces sp. rh34]
MSSSSGCAAPIAPSRSMPGEESTRTGPRAGAPLGIWVKRQCTLYGSLHPDQQHLLAAIGITRDAARARVGPRDSRRLTTTPRFDTDVAHARSYTAQHGHLAARSSKEHEGFPIGRWLAEHRQRARKRTATSPSSTAASPRTNTRDKTASPSAHG